MKKLMILAAAVCAAIVTQASMVSWSLTGSGTSQKNKAYYIFDATDRTTILSLLEAGTSTGKASEILANSTWTSAIKASGQLDGTPLAQGNINLGEGVATKTPESYFAIVFNKGETTVADATKYYVSADAAGQSYTSTTQSDSIVAEMSISGVTLTAIAVQDVPEPTSAMLLLLGVAGIALRRRRA